MVDIRNGNGENGLTALFVRRPVFAFVLNTLIAVAGLAAFYGVEIRELPDVGDEGARHVWCRRSGSRDQRRPLPTRMVTGTRSSAVARAGLE